MPEDNIILMILRILMVQLNKDLNRMEEIKILFLALFIVSCNEQEKLKTGNQNNAVRDSMDGIIKKQWSQY